MIGANSSAADGRMRPPSCSAIERDRLGSTLPALAFETRHPAVPFRLSQRRRVGHRVSAASVCRHLRRWDE